MTETLYQKLEKDVRYIEGLKACFNCGICTAICPAAEVSDYDPRVVVDTVQKRDESEQGRKQLAVKRTVGDHILKYGYCVYIDEVDNDMYPEQGPVWKWLRENRESMLERLGASYKKNQSGTLRNTSQESLDDLKKIFDETGGTKRLEKIEKDSAEKAKELNIDFKEGKDDYFTYLYNE